MKPLNNPGNYQKRFIKYGKSYKSLAWNTKEAQEIRFRELLKDIDLDKKSILDFGCGMGDIIPYISKNSKHFEYKGVDIIPEFIKEATNTYKNRSKSVQNIKVNFLLRDLIKNPLRKKYDVVICSGALNSNVNDVVIYRRKAIRILWSHTKEVLTFNMAGGYPQPENKKTNRVFYDDSLDVLNYCFSLTSKIIFRHHYRSRDFTLVMFR